MADPVTTKPSEMQKLYISFLAGVLFFVLASPFAYHLTGYVFKGTSSSGVPNYAGVLLHAVVFAICVRLAMFLPSPVK